MASKLSTNLPRTAGMRVAFAVTLFILLCRSGKRDRDLSLPTSKVESALRTRDSLSPPTYQALEDTLPATPAVPAPWTPIGMLAEGCTGSTITVKILKTILEDQGYPVLDAKKELFKPVFNKYYNSAESDLKSKLNRTATKPEIVVESLRRYEAEARSKKQILVFAAEGVFGYRQSLSILQQMQYKTILQYRSNLVEHSVCKLRDCMGQAATRAGHPVFTNGTRANLCFARRKSEIPIKAYVKTFPEYKKMLSVMKGSLIDTRKTFSSLESSNSVAQSYESLFAFEYSDDETDFQLSLQAWKLFLGDIGVPLSEKLLVSTLRGIQNTRPPPAHVSQTIYNWDEVEKNLGPSWEQDWIV